MNVTSGIQEWQNAFLGTEIFGLSLLIPLIIVLLTLLLITRNPRRMAEMSLPVSMGWYITGLNSSPVILGICFIISMIAVIMDNEKLVTEIGAKIGYLASGGEKGEMNRILKKTEKNMRIKTAVNEMMGNKERERMITKPTKEDKQENTFFSSVLSHKPTTEEQAIQTLSKPQIGQSAKKIAKELPGTASKIYNELRHSGLSHDEAYKETKKRARY